MSSNVVFFRSTPHLKPLRRSFFPSLRVPLESPGDVPPLPKFFDCTFGLFFRFVVFPDLILTPLREEFPFLFLVPIRTLFWPTHLTRIPRFFWSFSLFDGSGFDAQNGFLLSSAFFTDLPSLGSFLFRPSPDATGSSPFLPPHPGKVNEFMFFCGLPPIPVGPPPTSEGFKTRFDNMITLLVDSGLVTMSFLLRRFPPLPSDQ